MCVFVSVCVSACEFSLMSVARQVYITTNGFTLRIRAKTITVKTSVKACLGSSEVMWRSCAALWVGPIGVVGVRNGDTLSVEALGRNDRRRRRGG